MRRFHFLIAMVFSAGAAFAAEPAGVYNFPDDIADAQACAHACDEDSLCMAWIFQGPGKCGLSAVDQTPRTDDASIVGVSTRAPAFMRRRPALTGTVQSSATPNVTAPSEPAPQALDDIAGETALLGGPDAGAIRSRLR